MTTLHARAFGRVQFRGISSFRTRGWCQDIAYASRALAGRYHAAAPAHVLQAQFIPLSGIIGGLLPPWNVLEIGRVGRNGKCYPLCFIVFSHDLDDRVPPGLQPRLGRQRQRQVVQVWTGEVRMVHLLGC